ncbi:MAG TPA: cyclic nucleotide-binding domain-containing protein [Ramlibacter sp.]
MAELSPSEQLGELTALAEAVRRSRGAGLRRLSDETWGALSGVLRRQLAPAQTCLIRQGARERRVYLVESGLLRVYRTHGSDRLQLSVIGPGSVVGEGAFFLPLVRNASVEAIERAVVWELSLEGFESVAASQPQHALAFALYLGAVLSGRMLKPTGRLSVT